MDPHTRNLPQYLKKDQIRKELVLGSGPPNKPSPGSLGNNFGFCWGQMSPPETWAQEAKHMMHHQLIEGHEIP